MYPEQADQTHLPVAIMFSTKTGVFAQPMTDRQTLVKPMSNSDTSDITEEWIRIFDQASHHHPLPSFGEAFENTATDSAKKQEIPASYAKVEEVSWHVDERSKTLPTVLAGVIRHTSHPERSLAYYYSYRG